MTTKPAQALFDLEKAKGIRIDWQQVDALCAEAGCQLFNGIEAGTIPCSSGLLEGGRAVFAHTCLELDRDLDDLYQYKG